MCVHVCVCACVCACVCGCVTNVPIFISFAMPDSSNQTSVSTVQSNIVTTGGGKQRLRVYCNCVYHMASPICIVQISRSYSSSSAATGTALVSVGGQTISTTNGISNLVHFHHKLNHSLP